MKKLILFLTVSTMLLSNEFEDEYKKNDNQMDLFKPYNETMTSFNDSVYKEIFLPVSNTYKIIIPETPRNCISNFFDNLFYPIRLVNNLLQFKLINSLEETERFIINTTLGFGGIIDIAKNDLGIKQHNEDFGQTLGFYGIPSGEHIVLPILGPSNVRDIFGLAGDYVLNPVNYVNNKESLILTVEYNLNDLPKSMENYNILTKDAIQLYPLLKETYESYRLKEIKN